MGGGKMREIHKYNPALLEPKGLKRFFVGRGVILDRVLMALKEGIKMPSNPHFLFIGSKGMGKTHLLLLIYYIVKGKISWGGYKIPKRGWIPLIFSEESYSITTIEDLFFEICKKVQEEINNSRLQSFLKGVKDKALFEEHFIDQAISILEDVRDDKKYLLLIDNLHEILETLGEKGQQKLRGILQTYNFFVIIGTATTYFEAIANYEKPLYNFFQTLWLEELSFEEIKEIFLKLEGDKRKIEEIEPKIKAIGHLTGGNPRLILSLYKIIKDFGIIAVERQLISLLDELTPYMRDVASQFPPQQRKILEALAINRSPMTPTEIAKFTKLKVGIVTSQLKRLEGHVRVLKEKGRRETLYDIKDKLFSLWRQMRVDASKRRLLFIVRFLEIWYRKEELEKIAERSIKEAYKALEKNTTDRAILEAERLYYIAEALHEKDLHLPRIGIYIEAGDYEKAEREIKRLKQEAREEKNEELFLMTLYLESDLYYKQMKFKEAIKILKKILSQNPENEIAWYNMGVSYMKLKDYKKAIKCYENAIEIKPKYYDAWNNLGVSYNNLKEYKKAIECWKKAIKINPQDYHAWFNLGNAYAALEKYEEAINCYKKGIKIKPDDYGIISEIGRIYYLKNKLVDAIKYAERAIKVARGKKDKTFIQDLSSVVVDVYLAFSSHNVKRGNYKKAFEQVEKAISYAKEAKEVGEVFASYLKELLNKEEGEFLIKILKLIKEKGPENLKEFLSPYLYALNYLEKKDRMVLLRTPQEIREIVKEIYEKLIISS